MLTSIRIRNLKQLEDVELELGNNVVLIGPNNSGKTTALQALSLWHTGLKEWLAKREGRSPQKRAGVAVNRKDLLAMPVPSSDLLWRNLKVRHTSSGRGPHTRQRRFVRIEILVRGISNDSQWECGLEFEYANPESLYCRPLRSADGQEAVMGVPPQASEVKIAFLPPMSGLTLSEDRLGRGSVNRLIGEGRTAEVLRNLCYVISSDPEKQVEWEKIREYINRMFYVKLNDPQHDTATGIIDMTYIDHSSTTLDLSASGRGMLQVLLLLTYLYVNPGSVLLLDEPFSALDDETRSTVRDLVGALTARHAWHTILVSHHIEDVAALASRRYGLRGGQLAAIHARCSGQ